MALDATQDDSAVIGVLIDGVERGLGPLAIKVFSAPVGAETTDQPKPVTAPKVAAEHHTSEISAVQTAADGLGDDLMTLIEDGVLELTETLVILTADLLRLANVATEMLTNFTPGNSISKQDLDGLDDLFTDFGVLLKTARESTLTSASPSLDVETPVVADDTPEGDQTGSGETDVAEGSAPADVVSEPTEEGSDAPVTPVETEADGGGEEDNAEEEVTTSETEEQDKTPETKEDDTAVEGGETEEADTATDDEVEVAPVEVVEEAAVEDAVPTDPDTSVEPGVRDVVFMGQDALDTIDGFTDDLLDLYFGYKDTESPQLADGFDWMTMRQRMLGELEGLHSKLSAALEQGDMPPEEMMDMIETTMSVVGEKIELVEAVKLTMADDLPEEPTETGPTNKNIEQDETPKTEVEETVVEGVEAEETGAVTDGEVEVEAAPVEVVEDPGPSVEDVTIAGQGALDDMDDTVDELMDLYFEFKDIDTPQLSDSIDWRTLRQTIMADLETLQIELVTALTQGDMPPKEMMGIIDATMLKFADKVDMMEAVKLTMGGGSDDVVGEDPVATPETRAGGPVDDDSKTQEPAEIKPTRTQLAAETQALLNRFDGISDEALEFFFEFKSIDGTRLFDGVDWQEFKAGADENIESLMSMVSAAIQDPNADLGDVMLKVKDMGKIATDMEGYMKVMGDTIAMDEPVAVEVETKAVADADTAPLKSAEPVPMERTDVVDTAEDMFGRVDVLSERLLELYFKPFSIDNPEIADSMDWMEMRREISGLSDTVRDQVTPLLYGPDQDLDKAMAIIEDAMTTITNYEDLTKAVGDFGVTDPAGPEVEVNWDNFQPEDRTELVFSTQDLMAMANDMSGHTMDMYMMFKDTENPRLSDNAPWMEYRAEVQVIVDEIRERMPELMAGSNPDGGMTGDQMGAARTFLMEQKGKLDDLSNEMDVWTTMPTLAVDQGRVWGDPHFVGEDGGLYDVQGVRDQHYNILSDAGLQVNARFDEWQSAGSGKTVMGAIGITLGEHQVEINKDGTVLIDGEEVSSGSYLDGKVTVTEDRFVHIKEEEYSFRVDFQKHSGGDHLNIENIQSDNAAADGVLPSGLWGVTVDYDDDARNGDSGSGTQGGGALEDLDGNITEKGDETTVEDYEVGGLFATDFEDHNRFNG